MPSHLAMYGGEKREKSRRQKKHSGGLKSWTVLFALTWFLAVEICGLLVFLKGFFLTRVELGHKSDCADWNKPEVEELSLGLSDGERRGLESSLYEGNRTNKERCWTPQMYKKAIWIVVDALRYDFALWNESGGQEEKVGITSVYYTHLFTLRVYMGVCARVFMVHLTVEGGGGTLLHYPFMYFYFLLPDHHHHPCGISHCGQEKYYINHLPTIRDVIAGNSSFGGRGLLYQFEADPPTVTTLRLKGLTTGCLPTFIDVRDNFHSPQVSEDSWVSQLKHLGRRLVFMGDDTWVGLYPNAFHRSFPYFSFNTR